MYSLNQNDRKYKDDNNSKDKEYRSRSNEKSFDNNDKKDRDRSQRSLYKDKNNEDSQRNEKSQPKDSQDNRKSLAANKPTMPIKSLKKVEEPLEEGAIDITKIEPSNQRRNGKYYSFLL